MVQLNVGGQPSFSPLKFLPHELSVVVSVAGFNRLPAHLTVVLPSQLTTNLNAVSISFYSFTSEILFFVDSATRWRSSLKLRGILNELTLRLSMQCNLIDAWASLMHGKRVLLG